MENFDRKKHWQTIYETKTLKEVSWFQPIPETSLNLFQRFNLPKTSKIIDVGGGDSFLVDNLLELGYENISVLDISAAAISRAKQRLGERSEKVQWIIEDIVNFVTDEQYDFWHDRAAFHFLTEEEEVKSYVNILKKSIKQGGILVIGTFSEEGPKKCSGIEIKQYAEMTMSDVFAEFFEKIDCINTEHTTPFDSTQNFIFCSFKRK
jgi:2-polyprenyl-3-methyl-5-hydroxy-6-metoxy-1,4-benzoquinol methylase